MRGLESEFGESSNAIRLELNRFEQAGLLSASMQGNKKIFRANTRHPLFKDIHNLLLKYIGFDQIIDKIINKFGDLRLVFVVGEFAKGKDSQIIDLLFVGNDIDREYLARLMEKAEKLIKRKISSVIYTPKEFAKAFPEKNRNGEMLLLWKGERQKNDER